MLVPFLAAPSPDYDALKTRLDRICAPFRGRIGYCVRDLRTGRTIDRLGDERFPTASTIKTAIAVHVMREIDAGRLKWTDTREVPPAAKRGENDVSEWSYYLKDGLKLNVDGWTNLMIVYSDNLATRVLREWLGSVNVNKSLAALGFTETLSLSSVPASETRLRKINGQFGMGVTTPKEMARLMALIAERKAASAAGSERLLRMLGHQYWDDWIGSTVPPEVRVCSKSGAISRSRSDTAIVWAKRPYVLTIYTDSQKDRRWTDENEGDRSLVRISTEVWNALGDRPYVPPPGARNFLPTGAGIE